MDKTNNSDMIQALVFTLSCIREEDRDNMYESFLELEILDGEDVAMIASLVATSLTIACGHPRGLEVN